MVYTLNTLGLRVVGPVLMLLSFGEIWVKKIVCRYFSICIWSKYLWKESAFDLAKSVTSKGLKFSFSKLFCGLLNSFCSFVPSFIHQISTLWCDVPGTVLGTWWWAKQEDWGGASFQKAIVAGGQRPMEVFRMLGQIIQARLKVCPWSSGYLLSVVV